MAKFAGNYLKVADVEYLTVGQRNTPLFKMKLIEDIRKKNDDGKWETVDKNFFDAEIWGERATEASLEISDGTLLDLTPEIADGDKGQWVKYKADVEEKTWTYNDKTYSKLVVKIWNWDVIEPKGDN